MTATEGKQTVPYCYCTVNPHPYNPVKCGPGMGWNNAPIDRTQSYPYERVNDAYVENELDTQYA